MHKSLEGEYVKSVKSIVSADMLDVNWNTWSDIGVGVSRAVDSHGSVMTSWKLFDAVTLDPLAFSALTVK